jgi:hypothetical protein
MQLGVDVRGTLRCREERRRSHCRSHPTRLGFRRKKKKQKSTGYRLWRDVTGEPIHMQE